mmetsp:Transcript_29543/g.71985  ORF Transcript_29543/g.71985 Transcript_29543/m.71985 type:complete len:366 (+) Transcript_29543:145-1242(+)|eukprot:CAMPEP_0114495582 /NCGR_PEP_ID=MMETSP0109-20121206/5290_1 /TAXON_ID=29199 /ORGANISM="Chlorarachnion reptans, Strain CCCM449" /LENGTH=365 /DNA_ID=CAMNT_0001672751 /DNA_START=330 /DNA_END=1427 /DNA_ORIENTATION=-
MSLNYSKWDNIVCSSDDDDDCHPNIDKKLWRRLMKEKRQQKAAEEAARKKELEGFNEKDKKTMAELKEQMKTSEEKTKAELKKKEENLIAAIKKRDREILAITRRKKYTPEEMCHVVDERTVVNSEKKIDTDINKLDYEEYVKRYEKKLETYSKLTTESLSQGFLIKNPELLHEHCSGFLLLKALDQEMEGHSDDMRKTVKQYLIVQYVLDLTKSMGKSDPREVLMPFFKKLETHEKMQGLNDEVDSFAEKIKARAKVKLEERAKERENKKTFIGEDGKEYEYVELTKEERMGPGGLDPIEVLETLPESLKNAFEEKDMMALQKAIREMPVEEAKHHMDRCTKAGLWNPSEGESGAETATADESK